VTGARARRAGALALAAVAALGPAACGRYGPPVRASQVAAPPAPVETETQPPAEGGEELREEEERDGVNPR
jgi:hypothetical protein